jgi:hypothetical protein
MEDAAVEDCSRCSCYKDVSQGEEKKRRRFLSSTGHADLLTSSIAELDIGVDAGRVHLQAV